MKTTAILGAAAALVTLGTLPAAAQTLFGTTQINDRVTDIEDTVERDFERSRDALRFGNPEFQQGMSGSVSLAYTGQDGNTDTQDIVLGARLRHAAGPFVQSLVAALEFSEANGTETSEDVFLTYDGNYYFNDRFYAFGLARLNTDGLADVSANPGQSTKVDAFLGFGPGVRVINTPQTAWRLQAGVGVSYLEDGLGRDDTEVGYIASSRFYHSFNESIFVTNDTDVLYSDTATRVNNDLGVNFKMTDTLSTRVSYLTEYNDSRAIEFDNRLGIALVAGF